MRLSRRRSGRPEAATRLAQLEVGATAVIGRLRGDRAFRSRALTMGFAPGRAVSVIAAAAGGGVVVEQAGQRWALDRGSAELIEIAAPLAGSARSSAPTSVRQLAVGERAIVRGYAGAEAGYRARLLAMGLTRGTVLELVQVAPLGDPVKIEVRGYGLSLRKAEADALTVERLP